jgi:predicted DNA-binding transcriptional regulator AlpA
MKHTATRPLATTNQFSDIAVLVQAVKQVVLRPALASEYIGVSRTTLHRLSENDPSFPRKIVISRRCVGYRVDALDSWLAQKEMGP